MTRKKLQFSPDYSVHPSAYIRELMETTGMKQSELAIRLGITTKHMANIMTGKVSITTGLAQALQAVFGRTAEYWLALQSNYDLNKRRLEQNASYRTKKTIYDSWLSQFNYDDLIRHGFIEAGDLTEQPMVKIRKLLDYFGCSDIDSWHRLYNSSLPAACRIAGAKSSKTGHSIAWVRYGYLKANQNKAFLPQYDKSLFRQAVREIRQLTTQTNDFMMRMTELCQKAGVCLLFTPEISGTDLCGAAFWVGNRATPCIQMSHRFRKNDHFWFTFFHEAGHILHEHKKIFYVDSDEKATSEAEETANRFARDILIPPNAYNRFIRCADYSEKSIRQFAASINIHPGIVAGRLQHELIIPWSWHNGLKETIEWHNQLIKSADSVSQQASDSDDQAQRKVPAQGKAD